MQSQSRSLLSAATNLHDAQGRPVEWDRVEGPYLFTKNNHRAVDFSLGCGPDRLLDPEVGRTGEACAGVLKCGCHLPGYGPEHHKLASKFEKPYAEVGVDCRVIGLFKSSSEANTAVLRCARLLSQGKEEEQMEMVSESDKNTSGGFSFLGLLLTTIFSMFFVLFCGPKQRTKSPNKKRTKVLRCGFLGWHDWQIAGTPSWHEPLNSEKRYKRKYDNLTAFCLGSDGQPEYLDWVDLELSTLEKILCDHGDSIALFAFDVYQLAFLGTELFKNALLLLKSHGVKILFDETKTAGRRGCAGYLPSARSTQERALVKLADFHVLGKAIGNGLALSVLLAKVLCQTFDGKIGFDGLEALVEQARIGGTHSKELSSVAAGLTVVSYMENHDGYARLARVTDKVVEAFNIGFRRAGCGGEGYGAVLDGDAVDGGSDEVEVTVINSIKKNHVGSCLVWARSLFDGIFFELCFSDELTNDHVSRQLLQAALFKYGVFVLQGHNSFVGLVHERLDFDELADRVQFGTEEWAWNNENKVGAGTAGAGTAAFEQVAGGVKSALDLCLALSEKLDEQDRDLDGEQDWDAMQEIGTKVSEVFSGMRGGDAEGVTHVQRLLRHAESGGSVQRLLSTARSYQVWGVDAGAAFDGITLLKTDKIAVELHVWAGAPEGTSNSEMPHEHRKHFFSFPIAGRYKHHIYKEIHLDESPILDDHRHAGEDRFCYYFEKDDPDRKVQRLTDKEGNPMVLRRELVHGPQLYWIDSRMIHSVEVLGQGMCTVVIQDLKTTNKKMRVFQESRDDSTKDTNFHPRAPQNARADKDSVYAKIGQVLVADRS